MENEAELEAMLDGIGGIENIEDIDPEEEAKRGEALKVLLDRTQEIREKSEKGEECVYDATDVMNECNKVSEKVRFSSSAYLDALVLFNSSLTLKNCMETMGSQLNEYKSDEFSKRLMTCLQTRTLPKKQNKMELLENWTKKCFIAVMSYCSGQKGHMTDLTEVVQKTRQARRRENLDALPVKKPQTVEYVAKEGNLPEHHVSTIMQALIKRQRETNAPVPLFELLTNPHSFSETVENIFHFSHVYKEGLVEPCYDEDGMPSVKAILNEKPPAKKSKDDEDVVNTHYVITMNQERWKEIIHYYKIKESIIPSRRPHPK